ncbi:MAG: glycosyl transferase family 1 [Chloroflexus sp.]|uniref:glycosyltransferase family 4 protein n=1 Tax=Chloroflexus sp. TaxID=1904827 RepID=UPI0021DE3F45|nr:glycosyltransferase family 4 protein [Chloroflexus sp.]GIV87116.1 MAG: glycosyl transferase family 1 [Chloroflexus sp.]
MHEPVARTLVVATNAPVPGLAAAVQRGTHQRVDYLELAERFGSRHVDYGIVRKNRMLERLEGMTRLDLRLALRVAQIVRSAGYQAVISLSERVGIPLALILPKTVRHLVIFHHGMSAYKLQLIRMLHLQYRWDIVAAISEAEAKGMRQALGLSAERVVALHTPVDTVFYQPQPDGHSATVVQSLGLSHRDYPTLIRAMHRLPHIPCHLRVGSSWVSGRSSHEREVLPANISLQPFVSPVQLRTCYQQSRIVVVPIKASTQWSAGCTSVQAAQAMGRPVIATRRPGLAEYVDEGRTALLVEPGDVDGMADAIATLWENPDRAEQMGQAGRQLMEERFTIEQWLDRVVELTHKMMDCPVRRSTSTMTGSAV